VKKRKKKKKKKKKRNFFNGGGGGGGGGACGFCVDGAGWSVRRRRIRVLWWRGKIAKAFMSERGAGGGEGR